MRHCLSPSCLVLRGARTPVETLGCGRAVREVAGVTPQGVCARGRRRSACECACECASVPHSDGHAQSANCNDETEHTT
eukprot:964688-Alexandrium_andersonii.AAC.1